jgi:hypothetical protein
LRIFTKASPDVFRDGQILPGTRQISNVFGPCERSFFFDQIGKTTLAQNHLERLYQIGNYHNWDGITLRRQFDAIFSV